MNNWQPDAYNQGPQPARRDADALDVKGQIGDLISVALRHKLVLALCLILLPAAAFWWVSGLTPLYQASSQVLVEGRSPDALNIDSVVSQGQSTLEAVASEVQIIRSPETAMRVVQRLNLDQPPGPSPATFDLWSPPEEPSLLERISDTVAGWMDSLTAAETGADGAGVAEALPAPEFTDAERVARYLLQNLTVNPVGRSYVVSIGYASSDPVLAARIANAFAAEYLAGQQAYISGIAGSANDFLSKRIAQLEEEVRQAEQAIEAFRGQSDLVMNNEESPLTVQQLSELNSQLSIARSEAAEAKARLSELEGLSGPNADYGSIGSVLSSPLIQDLRIAESTLLQEIADAQEQYGDRHPTMIRMRAELADLRTGIRREVEKIIQGLRAEARIADVRVATLEAELDRFKGQLTGNSDALVKLRALERQAEASRRLLESFMLRSQELNAQRAFEQASAQIVSQAVIPTSPFFPRTNLVLALAVIGAGFLALLIIAVLEFMDRGYHSGEQVEGDTGLRTLGLIPRVQDRRGRRNLLRYMRDQPYSLYAESIRSVFTAIGAGARRTARTILVTSAYPGEGKTSTSVSLAGFAASMGWRVLLLDYDVRRPKVQTLLEVPPAPGILNVLSGEAALDEAVVHDPKSGIDMMGAGEGGNAIDLLNGHKVKMLLDRLSQDYDLIIVDSAPALALADTRVMSQLADGVILAVRWAHTSRRDLAGAIRQLDLSDKAFVGAVLTQVNLKRHAQYGYSDSVMYEKSMRRYYTG